MKLKINWDSKRCKHVIERMWLRGISMEEIKEAIQKGQKVRQRQTKLFESLYSYYSVIYDEMIFRKSNIRKVYPVTVKIM